MQKLYYQWTWQDLNLILNLCHTLWLPENLGSLNGLLDHFQLSFPIQLLWLYLLPDLSNLDQGCKVSMEGRQELQCIEKESPRM